jgi:hypothetical protein
MTASSAHVPGLCLLLTLSACGAPFPTLQEQAAGYQHPTYGYVLARRADGAGVLAPEWQPHVRASEAREVPMDQDADGVLDASLEVPVFDLLYTRGAAGGSVFVSTFPTSREAAAGDLGQILTGYVATAARAGQVAYGFPRTVPRSAEPMASRVLGSRPREVAGRPAHEILFEIADAPAERLTESTIWSRGHVVLVRPDLTFSDQQYSRTRGSSTAAFFPVLMVLGYANTADAFGAHHDEFEDLVSRLTFPVDADVTQLGGTLAECVAQETLVEFLVLPEGRVGAHAALADAASERCVSQRLVAARLARSDWPRTVAVRVGAAPQPPELEGAGL